MSLESPCACLDLRLRVASAALQPLSSLCFQHAHCGRALRRAALFNLRRRRRRPRRRDGSRHGGVECRSPLPPSPPPLSSALWEGKSRRAEGKARWGVRVRWARAGAGGERRRAGRCQIGRAKEISSALLLALLPHLPIAAGHYTLPSTLSLSLSLLFSLSPSFPFPRKKELSMTEAVLSHKPPTLHQQAAPTPHPPQTHNGLSTAP